MKTFAKRLLTYFKTIFSLDLKALSVFRIALGVLIIVDICIRISSFDAFFLDTGIMPLAILNNNHYKESARSIYSFGTAYWYQISLLGVHFIALISLIVGYKTRYSMILVWFMTVGLQSANPMILNGGDTLLRMAMFWAMFLPLGEYYSIDAKLISDKEHIEGRPRKEKPNSVFSAASIGFIVQIGVVYVFTYILKEHPIWNVEYSATYYALSIDAFRTALGDILYQYPVYMQMFTKYAYLLEGFGVVLLFIPFKNYRSRILAIILFSSFHLGLALTMRLGPFPWLAIIYWFALFPRSQLKHETISYMKEKKTAQWYMLQCFLVGVFLYILSRNIRTTDFNKHSQWFPYSINKVAFTLKIEQYRNMFAPYPMMDDGRFEIRGITKTGEEILLNNPNIGILYDDKPGGNRFYKNEKRHKRYSNMRQKDNSYLRDPYLRRICREYPEITNVTMNYMKEESLLDYKTLPIEKIELGKLKCPQY